MLVLQLNHPVDIGMIRAETIKSPETPSSATHKKPRSRRPGLVEYVVQQLEKLIAIQALKEGDKLPTESVLIEKFQVSRSVLREAISRMQASGVIQTKHGIGSFVTSIRTEHGRNSTDVLAEISSEIRELRLRITRLESLLHKRSD